MNWVAAGRKMDEASTTEIASTAVAKTGADSTARVLSPTWAVAQIEQAWCDVDELSECEWVACTVPMTHTRTIQSRQTILPNPLRFAPIPIKVLPT